MTPLPILPRNDLALKLLLEIEENRKYFLMGLLQFDETDYISSTVLNPYSTIEKLDDKITIMDVKLQLQLTLATGIVMIELQIQKAAHMNDRLLFGIAKAITEQKTTGQDYQLKKVVSILITNYDIPNSGADYHDRFQLRSDKTGIVFNHNIEVHTIQLTKLPQQTIGDNLLYDWASFIKAETQEEVDMLAANSPTLVRAANTLKEISEDAITRMALDSREAWIQDQLSIQRTARQEGLEEGILKGIEQGIEQGIERGAFQKATELALRLLVKNIPLEEVASLTDLDLDTVREINTAR